MASATIELVEHVHPDALVGRALLDELDLLVGVGLRESSPPVAVDGLGDATAALISCWSTSLRMRQTFVSGS